MKEANQPHRQKVACIDVVPPWRLKKEEHLALVKINLESRQWFEHAKDQLHVNGYFHIMFHEGSSVIGITVGLKLPRPQGVC